MLALIEHQCALDKSYRLLHQRRVRARVSSPVYHGCSWNLKVLSLGPCNVLDMVSSTHSVRGCFGMYELGFGFLLHSELLSSPCYDLSLIVWGFRFREGFGKR